MKMTLLLPLALLISGPVVAQCPPAPDPTEPQRALSDAAQAASNEADGREVSNQMWQLWVQAADAQAQAVLDRGMQKRESYDLLGAIGDFTTLIEYCPGYAEGYNQRAFAFFLQQNYAAALPDLDKALDLNPGHVAARSGRALTHMQLGNLPAAREDLKAALKDNPWLSERHLLAKGGPLAPPGDDI